MGLDILKRVAAYVTPLAILAIAVYGMHSTPARTLYRSSGFSN